MRDNDSGAVFWMLLAAICIGIAAVTVLGGCAPQADEPTEQATVAVGHPLDAIRFKSPTWATGDASWRVSDRQTGQQWWLVELPTHDRHGNEDGTQWVALPRSEWEVGE